MKGIWLLLLLAGPAMAGDPSTFSHDELCIWRAAALIDPSTPPAGTAGAMAAELSKRGETCDDPSYVQIAEARLQAAERYASEQAHAQAAQSQDEREERNARIRAAGRAYLLLQEQQRERAQQNRPVTTTCHQLGSSVQCTTN